MTKPFRILSLSGGGMRGVYSAAVLCELEASLRNHTGRRDARLVEQFDLIVGTSTGGLLGLGMAFGKSPQELLDVYKSHGPKVFPPLWRNWRLLTGGPLFSQRRLRNIVEAMLPADKTLGEAGCSLILTAVRRDSGEVCCLKTKHHESFYKDHTMSAVEAGLATAAAPIAFPHMQAKEHGQLIDGGLWANTPIMVGLIEAKKYFGRNLDDVRVLSVGTTRSKMGPRPWWRRPAMAEYLGPLGGRLQDLVWEGQRQLAIQAARLILPDGALVHVDTELARGVSLMDARPRSIAVLEEAGRAEGQRASEQVCATFWRCGASARDGRQTPMDSRINGQSTS